VAAIETAAAAEAEDEADGASDSGSENDGRYNGKGAIVISDDNGDSNGSF